MKPVCYNLTGRFYYNICVAEILLWPLASGLLCKYEVAVRSVCCLPSFSGLESLAHLPCSVDIWTPSGGTWTRQGAHAGPRAGASGSC